MTEHCGAANDSPNQGRRVAAGACALHGPAGARHVGLLLPNTPLPSGWAIDPVSGNCVRISDATQVGATASRAIAWSMLDVDAAAGSVDADLARLRNAIGCAAIGAVFTGNAGKDRELADAVHGAGAGLAADASRAWQWRAATGAVTDQFNRRLDCFLDAIALSNAALPTMAAACGEVWLLAGAIGRLSVRSELRVAHGAGAAAALSAQACANEGDALQRARAWAIERAYRYAADAAKVASAALHHVPFHEHDAACARIERALDGVLAANVGQHPA